MAMAGSERVRVVFGQPHFSDRHSWENVVDHFPPGLSDRVVVETVEPNRLAEHLRRRGGVDVIVPVMSAVSAEVFAAGVGLVQQFGVGVERIDLAAAHSYRTPVANMPGLNAGFVAERGVALLLSLLHRLPEARQGFAEGAWSTPSGRSLSGSTGCVIGLGAVGTALIERLAPFHGHILGVHRTPPAPGAVSPAIELVHTCDIEKAVRRSDWVIMAATNRAGAGPILTAELIGVLPESAIVVNVARGGAIDNDAALAALHAGRLGGLGLDVFPIEPYPPDGPLLSHPGVLATAHTAALTDAYFAAAAARLGEAVQAYLDESPVPNLVTERE